MSKFIALLAAVFLLTVPAAAKTLKPVDEAARDAGLRGMIQTLLKACDDKDFKPFEAALSPDAIASFGGDSGVQGFKEAYGIDDPNTTFYADFKATLLLGGAFMDDESFAAPYIYAQWPEDLDSFAWVVAIGDKTMIYLRPGEKPRAVADVTHQFLEVIEDAPQSADAAPEGWVHVKAGKTGGYVKSAEVRSPLDYRAVFQKTANRWWLGAFVAGD